MERKPIFLLADSQLLFLKNEYDEYYLKLILKETLNDKPKCAYIGVSNGDQREFFDLFVNALSHVGVHECKMITTSFDAEEQAFLNESELILLAGGDTELGLRVFREKGIEDILLKKYNEGAVLVGVSAGAVQLGWESSKVTNKHKRIATDTLKLVPFAVMVHLPKKDTEEVEAILDASGTMKRAYEIPLGGGLICYPDNSVEAIRKPINEYLLIADTLTHNLIYPKSDQEK